MYRCLGVRASLSILVFHFSSSVMCMSACTCRCACVCGKRRDSLSAAVPPLGSEPRSTTMPSRQTLSSPPATTDPLFSVCNTRLSCTFSTRGGRSRGGVTANEAKTTLQGEKSQEQHQAAVCAGSAEGEEKEMGQSLVAVKRLGENEAPPRSDMCPCIISATKNPPMVDRDSIYISAADAV